MRKRLLLRNPPFSGGPKGRVRPPSPWANNFWKVWLDCEDDLQRSIQYVNENPLKAGLTQQNWKFVVPYSP
jgi:hypothetical protein